VPVDDKIFQKINDAQWAWYQTQIIEDETERFELQRDITEYGAMFVNPDAVRQVRENRDNVYETSEEDFDAMLKETFGRGIPKVENKEMSIKDFKKSLQDEIKKDKKKKVNQSEIEQYLNMDLDLVNFIPYK